MSLVERAVDMLDTPAAAERSDARSHPRTERWERADLDAALPEHAGPAALETEEPPPREAAPAAFGSPAATGVSRRVQVNVQHLRERCMIAPDMDRTEVTESFRRIKRHVLSALERRRKQARNYNLVGVTSALPGEGKTYCALNLALSIAMEVERSVLLVDGDVTRPSITSALGILHEGEQGLMDVLLDGVRLPDVLCRTDIGQLTVLPAGRRHAHVTEVFASDAMRRLLDELATRYDDRVVIFDSAPVLSASEASVLAGNMGQLLFVVEAGRTTHAAVARALSRLENRDAVGMVLNKGVPPGTGLGGYGYGYGYGYGNRPAEPRLT